MKRKRCLVLGATGNVGSILRDHVKHSPAPVDFIWQARTQRPQADSTQWMVWDGAKGEDLTQAIFSLEGGLPDLILNLAGKTPATQGKTADLITDTVQLTQNVLEAARALSIPHLICCSSAAVYGRPETPSTVFNEATNFAPLTVYGTAKVEMEQIMLQATKVRTTALRIGNIAGADALLGQLLAETTDAPLTLDIFPSGYGPKRSYIGPKSLAVILVNLAINNKDLPSVLNVSGDGSVYMDQLLRSWQKKCPGEGTFTPRPASDTAIESVVLDVSALRRFVDVPLADSDALVDEVLFNAYRKRL